MLAAGNARMWNDGNVVCAVLAARGLLETIAVCDHVRTRLNASTETGAIDAIDESVSKLLFATRDGNSIALGVGHQATNVLTYIDKLSDRFPDIRSDYEFLSEWCHPNSSGHLFTYGEINRSTGDVRFAERTPRVVGMQGYVITIFMMIAFVELAMNDFDAVIPKIAAMDQNQGAWVPAAPG
jgi:hypothetical protein